jgi:hypothetical protein
MGQADQFDLVQPGLPEAQTGLVVDAGGIGRQVRTLTTLIPANRAMA